MWQKTSGMVQSDPNRRAGQADPPNRRPGKAARSDGAVQAATDRPARAQAGRTDAPYSPLGPQKRAQTRPTPR